MRIFKPSLMPTIQPPIYFPPIYSIGNLVYVTYLIDMSFLTIFTDVIFCLSLSFFCSIYLKYSLFLTDTLIAL